MTRSCQWTNDVCSVTVKAHVCDLVHDPTIYGYLHTLQFRTLLVKVPYQTLPQFNYKNTDTIPAIVAST